MFKDIKNFEGIYQVNERGEVKSVLSDIILTPHNDGRGYLIVKLYKNGRGYNCKVHRLVALAFIDNPNRFPQINHKDENKLNNEVSNLEWCDQKYNNTYGSRLLKIKKSIYQLDLNGNFIKEWNSATDAARELKLNRGNICSCLLKRKKTAGGYEWIYVV